MGNGVEDRSAQCVGHDMGLVEPQAARPRVLAWFQRYCIAMSLMYLLATGLGGVLASSSGSGAVGSMIMRAALPLMILYAASPYLPARPWAWVYDLVLIAIGFGSIVTIPFAVALLIYWIKPETQAHFGRAAA